MPGMVDFMHGLALRASPCMTSPACGLTSHHLFLPEVDDQPSTMPAVPFADYLLTRTVAPATLLLGQRLILPTSFDYFARPIDWSLNRCAWTAPLVAHVCAL